VSVREPVREENRPGTLFSSSFEGGTTAWSLTPGAEIVEGEAAEGKAALRLASGQTGTNPKAFQGGIPCEPGKRYRLAYAVKAGGGTAAREARLHTARVGQGGGPLQHCLRRSGRRPSPPWTGRPSVLPTSRQDRRCQVWVKDKPRAGGRPHGLRHTDTGVSGHTVHASPSHGAAESHSTRKGHGAAAG
jgi:hypothetical protein